MTLKEFLTQERHIPLRDKWILAVVLSHAALHGSGGPWLNENWSKEHITFFKKDGLQNPDLRRPFLKISVDEEGLGLQGRQSGRLNCNINSSFEGLGIMLLEILSGATIESKWAQEDLDANGEPNEYTNLTTALRVLKEHEHEVYEGYRAAVQACLDVEMSSPESADSLAKKVYDRIVAPLERELEHGFKLRPEQFDLVPDVQIPVAVP
jgi:hypothetical protein